MSLHSIPGLLRPWGTNITEGEAGEREREGALHSIFTFALENNGGEHEVDSCETKCTLIRKTRVVLRRVFCAVKSGCEKEHLS